MPAAGRVPGTSAPAGFMDFRRRSTAPAGAAAPSRAQDNPPNAIMLVLTAALANVTRRASPRFPAAASFAIDANTSTFAPSTSKRLQARAVPGAGLLSSADRTGAAAG